MADLDSVDAAKKDLERQISAIENEKYVVESPISIAFDLESLKSSTNTDQNFLASLYREIVSMRSDVRDMKKLNVRNRISSQLIQGPEDLFILLKRHDESYMLSLLEQAQFDEFEKNSISMTTSLKFEEEAHIENELPKILFRATGEQWRVSVIPF